MGLFGNLVKAVPPKPAPSYVKCCLCGSKMNAVHLVFTSTLGANFQGCDDAFVCTKCKAVFPRKL